MADNVAITAGSGTSIATDEISIDGATAHVQRVKVVSGAAGSGTDVSTTNPMPIDQRTLAGTAVDTNSGSKSAGTQRVVLATDQPALTNKLLVTPDSVALPANQSVNMSQINGVTTTMNNGVSGTGVQRVTIASDSTGQVAIAANATSTGTSIYKNTALSSTKAAANASAGNLFGYHIYNPNSAVTYVQFFNVASAGVTVGSTAADMILAIPASGWADSPASGPPVAFGTALTVAATTTATGSSAPTTGLLVNLFYK